MKNKFVLLGAVVVVVLVVRFFVRSAYPNLIPDNREFGNAEWWRNYDAFHATVNGYTRVRKGDKYGMVDSIGKEVLAPEYDFLNLANDPKKILCQKDGYWQMVNIDGRIYKVLMVEHDPLFWKLQYLKVGSLSGDMIKVKSLTNDLYGFVDENGMEWIPCQFKNVGDFSNGFAYIEKNGLYGFIDGTGKEIVPTTYQEVNSFFDGLAWVKRDNKCGFIDIKGKTVIPLEYDAAGYFFNGVTWLEKQGLYALAGKDGKLYSDFVYEEIKSAYNGYAVVKKGGKWGVLDTDGTEKLPCVYDEVNDNAEGFVSIKKGKLWGFAHIDTGKELVKPTYNEVFAFYHNKAVVSDGKKYGLVDTAGKLLLPVVYDDMGLGGDSIVRVCRGDLWGFYNLNSRQEFAVQYKSNQDFKDNGMALVESTDGLWGYINTAGEEIIAPIWNNIGSFSESGIATKDNVFKLWKLTAANMVLEIINKPSKNPLYQAKYQYLSSVVEGRAFVDNERITDEYGKTIAQIPFLKHYDFSEGLAAVKSKNNNKWGFIRLDGTWALPPAFEEVYSFHEELAAVRQGEKWGFINKKGTVVVPCIFDKVKNFKNGTARVEVGGYKSTLSINSQKTQ